MKASKKLLSLLLVVMLLVSAIPFQAFAEEVRVTVLIKDVDGKAVDNGSIPVPDDGATLGAALASANALVIDGYEYVRWEDASGNTVSALTNDEAAGLAADGGYLVLVLRELPTTFTATLKATLDGVDVATDIRRDITSIDLTEELAKSLYTSFDASKHQFKGWAGGLSGTQTLEKDTTFTAVFETIPAPTYDVTVSVFRRGVFVTSQVLTDQSTITLNNALAKEVYDDFDSTKETAQWYTGSNCNPSNKVASGTSVTLTGNASYSVNIEAEVPVDTHNITVYAVRFVGNGTTYVNRGVVSTPLFTAEINGTVNVLDYLESTENWSVIESNANRIGKIRTNPTFYTDSNLTTRLKNETLTDASKTVYVRVDAEEVKNVLLYVHKGSSITNLTNLDPKVLHGYEAGEYVTYEAVQSILGSGVKFYGLFTEARWDNLNASIKDDQLPKIQVPAGGVEIHVWVYSGNVSNADSTNPKTGDYILDTAVTLMVISGLAAAAVYVVGKKRRV